MPPNDSDSLHRAETGGDPRSIPLVEKRHRRRNDGEKWAASAGRMVRGEETAT